MSLSPSRVSEDKMHRYLQRIQRLVGARSKSPVSVMKSRSRSPAHIKTPQLNRYINYEYSFKVLFAAVQKIQAKLKTNFLRKLLLFKKEKTERIYRFVAIQRQSPSRKTSTKQIALILIWRTMKHIVINRIRMSFIVLKKDFEIVETRDKNKSSERKNYPEIYQRTINRKYQQSFSPFKDYYYKTPTVDKKIIDSTTDKNARSVALFFIFNQYHKALKIYSLNQLKSHIIRLKNQQINQLKLKRKKIQNQKTSKIQNVIEKQKNQNITHIYLKLQILKQNLTKILKKYQYFYYKQIFYFPYKQICQQKMKIRFFYFHLQKVIIKNNTWAFNRIFFHHRLQSKSKIDLNLKTIANNLNSKISIKKSLLKMYRLGFQKIEQYAFITLVFTRPLQRPILLRKKQVLDKIRFNYVVQINKKCQLGKKTTKNIKPLINILSKIEKQYLYLKIQAYSQIKFTYQKKKLRSLSPVINQKTLRKELSEFIDQRSKVKEKTLQSWQKTKKMLTDHKRFPSNIQYI